MVEPMYYYYNNERGYQDVGFNESSKTVVIGVGVFSLNPVGDDSKVEIYWGLRAGYMSITNTTFDTRAGYTSSDESSVIYEPTLGVQYFFTPKFSVSANASLMFQSGSVDEAQNGQSYLPYDHNFSGSLAKVIVRGYFN